MSESDGIYLKPNEKKELVDELWAEEADDRVNAYNEGKIKSVSLEEVLKKYTTR
ncbi:MAG: addiction module protein [Planctomycetota bacterium]|jgi:hypothetical protein